MCSLEYYFYLIYLDSVDCRVYGEYFRLTETITSFLCTRLNKRSKAIHVKICFSAAPAVHTVLFVCEQLWQLQQLRCLCLGRQLVQRYLGLLEVASCKRISWPACNELSKHWLLRTTSWILEQSLYTYLKCLIFFFRSL